HRSGRLRAGDRHLPDFSGAEVVGLEERVREAFEQVGDQSRIALAGEGVEVDPEGLGELDQQRGRQRPSIVFYEIEVAGRNAESLRQLYLVQALPPPQRPDLCPQPGSFSRHRFLHAASAIDCTDRFTACKLLRFTAVAMRGLSRTPI